MKVIAGIVIAVFLVFGGVFGGLIYASLNSETVIATPAPEIVYVTNTIETIREIPVTVTVEKIVNGRIGNFPDFATMAGWFKDHLIVLWGANGWRPDCDDYAERMVKEAHIDGFILHAQLINDGKLNGVQVSNILECHVGLTAYVGNEIYFIEPQPGNFRIVYVCPRD